VNTDSYNTVLMIVLCVWFMTRSHDAQLLIISSTDGYCTLITFDENELGSVYKKPELVAPVPVSSPVKPVHQVEECLSEVKIADSKELGIVETASVTKPVSTEEIVQTASVSKPESVTQPMSTEGIVQTASATKPLSTEGIVETASVTKPVSTEGIVQTASVTKLVSTEDIVQTASVTKPVSTDCSPQRKKARRVVLQTLSTNVADFANVTADGKTLAAKSLPEEPALTNSEKCRAAISKGDIGGGVLSSGHTDDFSKITNSELASDCEPESMDVCAEVQVTKVCIYFCC